MQRPAFLGFFRSYLFLGIVLFAFSIGFPPFDDQATVDLTTHMVEHVLIVVAGVLIGFDLFRRGLFSGHRSKGAASAGFLAVVALVAFWHLSDPWDAAVLNPGIHAAEHVSFLVVGLLIGSLLQVLSDYSKINALVLAFFAHMVYGIILISPLDIRVYPIYPFSQQSSLGLAILAPGPAYWAGVVYLLARNRTWFEGNQERPVQVARSAGGGRPHLPRGTVSLVLSLVLLSAMVGYYGTAAAAIGAQNHAPGRSTVYIVETPVSWQFSPQMLTVVLGVNSTVTWVSRSISYDTVTGGNGTLSSGPIAPGQSFSYSFSKPGVYEYKCIYHPWMVGHVTVLSRPTR